jgi:hypothetical protein
MPTQDFKKKHAKALELESQAEWPVFWASLQEYKAEMQVLKGDGGLKNISPMTDHETLELVLDHVRKTFPRINALYLNTKGTAEELALQRAVSLIKTQHTDVGLSTKRVHDKITNVHFGGFSNYDYQSEPHFEGNNAGYGDGDNHPPVEAPKIWQRRRSW